MDLSGVYPALTTPFAADGSVSIIDLKFNIQRYNGTGLTGYVVNGSTGESVLLSDKETESVLATVKEVAGQNKKLIAGTGAESTAETIRRTKRAADLGYHAALVKTPYYYKSAYKPEVLIAHYRRVADASPIPVLLYSVPQFTGVTLEAPEVAALATHPNIVGIKDSSGNVQRVADMLATVPAKFQILIGSAATVYPSMMIGAHGGILALASALPEECAALYALAKRGDLEKARELHVALAKASKVMVSDAGLTGVKFAMDQRGYRGGDPRLPLLPISENAKQKISQMLAAFTPATANA